METIASLCATRKVVHKHDLPIVGHCEEKNMRATLSKIFYWPKMKEDVEHYVRTCVKCQKSSQYTKTVWVV
jgi:hypothetical protein